VIYCDVMRGNVKSWYIMLHIVMPEDVMDTMLYHMTYCDIMKYNVTPWCIILHTVTWHITLQHIICIILHYILSCLYYMSNKMIKYHIKFFFFHDNTYRYMTKDYITWHHITIMLHDIRLYDLTSHNATWHEIISHDIT